MSRITAEQASKQFNDKGYNIDNLTILRDFLEEYKDDINLEMSIFCDDDYHHIPNKITCGTSACVLGHSAQIFEKDAFEGWWNYSNRFFVNGLLENRRDFLFGNKWPNDVCQAIVRINYVIENGDCPKNWTYNDRF